MDNDKLRDEQHLDLLIEQAEQAKAALKKTRDLKNAFLKSLDDQTSKDLRRALKLNDPTIATLAAIFQDTQKLSKEQIDIALSVLSNRIKSRKIKQYHFGDDIEFIGHVTDFKNSHVKISSDMSVWLSEIHIVNDDGIDSFIKTDDKKIIKALSNAKIQGKPVRITGKVNWIPAGQKFPIHINKEELYIER